MSIKKQLSEQLRNIQKELAIPHLPIDKLEKLSLETRKIFDESIRNLMIRRDILRKIDIHRDHIMLWKHKDKRLVIPINWRYLLSVPFIYGMVVPAMIWHVGLEIYNQICFRLYGIPVVKGSDYFVYDRQLMSYLNWWEKINCYYCSYANNLVRFSAEVGGRTERYWCPIKYAKHISKTHSQYSKFIAHENKDKFRKDWDKLRDFSDIKS